MRRLVLVGLNLGLVTVIASAQGPGPGGPPHGALGPEAGREPFGMMFTGPGSRTPVTGAPYSAVQVTQFQQTLEGGNQITREQQTKVYRDGQGRVRIESAGPARFGGQKAAARISIYDPVAGYSHMLNPQSMTAVSTAIPAGQGKRAEDMNGWGGRQRGQGHRPNAPQTTKEELGTQTINGISASGIRTTMTIPAGAVGNAQPIQTVREVWTSTDLKVPLSIKTTDPRFGTTVMQLTNITQGEPDASLFKVPAGYTVTERTRPARQQ